MITIAGRVIESGTNEPIVNVGVIVTDAAGEITSSRTGVATNFNGDWQLDVQPKDYVTFRSVNLKTKTFKALDLMGMNNVVDLSPSSTEIPEVIVKPKSNTVSGWVIALALTALAAIFNKSNND